MSISFRINKKMESQNRELANPQNDSGFVERALGFGWALEPIGASSKNRGDKILVLLHKKSFSTQKELAKEMNLSVGLINKELGKLRATGFVKPKGVVLTDKGELKAQNLSEFSNTNEIQTGK